MGHRGQGLAHVPLEREEKSKSAVLGTAVAINTEKSGVVVAVPQQSNLFHVPSWVHMCHTNPCPGTQVQANCKNTVIMTVIIKQDMQTYQLFFFQGCYYHHLMN